MVVEQLRPEIDGGRFPIKRTIGEAVSVTADVFADGHDLVAGVLKYRMTGPLRRLEPAAEPAPHQLSQWAGSGRAKAAADPAAWIEVPLTSLGDDRWGASFTVTQLGEYEYTVEAWIDRYGSWMKGLAAKTDAGQDVHSDLLEGADLVAGRPDRSTSTTYDHALRVTVEPVRARFGAWYEMFPRSCTADPTRSGTFREAEARLPDIAAMGFDVVYLPPVHPIGRTHRKGRNNSLVSQPGDPGSPWAIGSDEGGHTTIEPGLGSLDDFDCFVETASHLGLAVALDIAFQASPDHPWVGEHPDWFRHRPDGSIKYAENPPKKYQDIYPFDFESRDRESLWAALRDVFRFWIGHGVTIFRVDNPHTKPFRFWEWCIGEIKATHPETIFLSEAFTRPKVMRYLAKAGFSQSYTYFTWRNSAAELREYLTELTRTDAAEYLRPNFFANTPDILHEYLQRGGRPAFEARFVLAATLAASYGIYSGFELCENVASGPGSEEYLDSEKYEIKPRDWNQAGNLKELIAQVNAIRRDHPALQQNTGLRFHRTSADALLWFSKQSTSADLDLSAGVSTGASAKVEALAKADVVFVAVNTTPEHVQHGWVELPIGDFGIAPDAPYVVEDLLDGTTYTWRGDWNYVRLDPAKRMAHLFVIR